MQSLKLDPDTWDLTLDANRNIAIASEEESLAQDAACAIKLFRGELYYDTTKGVPYFKQILGKLPPLTLIKSLYVAAAMTVPGVVRAVCFLRSIVNRQLTGQVQVTDKSGNTTAAEF